MEREAFLQAIRARLGKPGQTLAKVIAPSPEVEQAEAIRQQVGQNLDGYLTTFQKALEAAGGFAHVATSRGEVVRKVLTLAREREVRSAIRWATPELDALGLEQAFHQEGIPLTSVGSEKLQDEEALKALLTSADLGLSGADFAVAETGSLVLLAEEGKGRLITLLPTYHIALLSTDRLVPTFQDLVTLLRLLPKSPSGRALRSAITFVTGPSKSGDIELHLTKGVHGPKELHVILYCGRSCPLQGPERGMDRRRRPG